MAKKQIRLVEDIEVIDLGDKGRAIGRAADGRIVLVEKAGPWGRYYRPGRSAKKRDVDHGSGGIP